MLPKEFVCPITGRTHSIVYKNQNKAKLIKYCNDLVRYLMKHPHVNKYLAVDTEGKINIADINDVFVIQFAECFRNHQNLLNYHIDGKKEESIDLQDGFIIFDPDNDVKKALRMIFLNYSIYTIFFDITRDILGLNKLGIPVNGLPDKNGNVKHHTVIDTQLRPHFPYFVAIFGLKTAVSKIDFPCQELEAAKAQFETKNSLNFSKLIYENLGASDSDIIYSYAQHIKYFSNDIAFTALSALTYIKAVGCIKDNHFNQGKQLATLWKGEANGCVKYGTLLLEKTVQHSKKILRNPENDPYSTCVCAMRLIKYYEEVKKCKKNFPFTKDELIQIQEISKEWINGDKSRNFPRTYDFYGDVAKFRISGNLMKEFLHIWIKIKDKVPHNSGNTLIHICKEIHPLLYDFLSSCESLSDIEMHLQCIKLYEEIKYGKINQHFA